MYRQSNHMQQGMNEASPPACYYIILLRCNNILSLPVLGWNVYIGGGGVVER